MKQIISQGIVVLPKGRLLDGQKFNYNNKEFEILRCFWDYLEENYIYEFKELKTKENKVIRRSFDYITELQTTNKIKLI